MKSQSLYWFLIIFNIVLIFLLLFSYIMYDKEGFHPIINSQINKHKRKINTVKRNLNGKVINVRRRVKKFLTF